MSEIAGFTAWLWLDLNNSTVARQHYLLAVYGAQQAQDSMLTAYMIGSLASVASDEGDTGEALALCTAVDKQLEHGCTPTARVWSTALRATALAGAGDRAPTLRLLGDAERMIDDSMAEGGMAWPWLYPYSADKLAATGPHCELLLGNCAAAKAGLIAALTSHAIAPRQRGHLLIDLARACLHADEVDESCGALSEALDLAVSNQSRRLLHSVHLVRSDLDRWRGATPVKHLDERLWAYSA